MGADVAEGASDQEQSAYPEIRRARQRRRRREGHAERDRHSPAGAPRQRCRHRQRLEKGVRRQSTVRRPLVRAATWWDRWNHWTERRRKDNSVPDDRGQGERGRWITDDW